MSLESDKFALSFEMDDRTAASIQKLLSEREQCNIHIQRGIRQLTFYSGTANIMEPTFLRILFLGTYRLTIANVSLKKQRQGTMSAALHILEDFCREYGIEQLVVQCVETEPMAAFCRKHGFTPSPTASYIFDGSILGEYCKSMTTT